MKRCIIAGVALLAMGPAGAQTHRIPLSAAVAQCAALDGPSRIAAAHYRDCVIAKSGKAPPEKKRSPGITISGSARLGIVVERP